MSMRRRKRPPPKTNVCTNLTDCTSRIMFFMLIYCGYVSCHKYQNSWMTSSVVHTSGVLAIWYTTKTCFDGFDIINLNLILQYADF